MADFIKEYWNMQGQIHGASHWASWGDHWMLKLEVENISQYIQDGDSVLDIGCANGHATFQQALKHSLKQITGLDYAESMVASALNEKGNHPEISCPVNFSIGDIRDLPCPDHSFDVVYTTRVLINLPNWEQQQKGIREALRVTRPGGVAIFSEAFWEPLTLLNSLRLLFGLAPLAEQDFNRYLKMEKTKLFLDSLGVQYEINDFSSVYYLGSRFLRELVTDPDAYPGFSNPINSIFYELEQQYSGSGVGVQQMLVVRP